MPDSEDDALTWAGDDRLQAPAAAAPRAAGDASAARAAPGAAAGGGAALVALGVLGGVAVLETVFWFRSVTELSIAASVVLGSDSPAGVAAYAVNIARRVLAVLAPLLWFGLGALLVRTPSRRFAWLLLGAVLLVPWPFVLEAT